MSLSAVVRGTGLLLVTLVPGTDRPHPPLPAVHGRTHTVERAADRPGHRPADPRRARGGPLPASSGGDAE